MTSKPPGGPGVYVEPEKIREMRRDKKFAKAAFWWMFPIFLITLLIHLYIFYADTFLVMQSSLCVPSEPVSLRPCPPYNGFIDNMLGEWWWWFSGVLALYYAIQHSNLTKAITRADAAHRESVALAATIALENSQTEAFVVDKYWFAIEFRHGRNVLVMYIRFYAEDRYLVGGPMHTESFLAEDVGWTQGEMAIYFRDRQTDGGWGTYPQIMSPERPTAPELPGGLPDYVQRF